MKKDLKPYYVLAGLAVFVAVAVFFINKSGPRILNVNDVASNPAQFTDVITVKGVVIGAWQKQNPVIIGMIDVRELQNLDPKRNVSFFPFRASDYKPVHGDEVNVTGQFVREPDKLVFEAEKVTVIKNHRLAPSQTATLPKQN